MHITIINDCHDDNVVGRQEARVSSLTGSPTSFVGVHSYGDLSAAGHLLDILDAYQGRPGGILVNVAPRHGQAKKWQNGTPFCYTHIDQTLIVGTFDGYIFSLLKKLGLLEEVSLMDTKAVTHKLAMDGRITDAEADRITSSQFRSFDFSPLVFSLLQDGGDVPSTVVKIDDVPTIPQAVWWVDNFGNVKTTMLPDDCGFEAGRRIPFVFGDLVCYTHLRDVPDKEAGVIIGSSGYGEKRLLEVVVQGQRASDQMNLAIGDDMIEEEVVSVESEV